MTDTRREEIANILLGKFGYGSVNIEDCREAVNEILSALTPAPEAGWRDMDDPELPMDGTQFLSMQDDWGPFVTWRDDTKNYPWRFLDRDNQENGFRDGEHGPTRWMPLPPAPGTQPATEQPSVKEAAVDALASYQQADADGIMVLVSRQAIEECLPALRSLAQGDE